MSRLHELIERELVVCACLQSATTAIRLSYRYRDRAAWLQRAESSLLFAAAELAYLTGPAPKVIEPHSYLDGFSAVWRSA